MTVCLGLCQKKPKQTVKKLIYQNSIIAFSHYCHRPQTSFSGLSIRELQTSPQEGEHGGSALAGAAAATEEEVSSGTAGGDQSLLR